jgi:hypothetical protein
MENKEQQILSEIKSMMASIRSQLERLDAKMAELQQVVDPENFEADSVDINIDEPIEDVTADLPEIQDDDLPFDDVPVEDAADEPVQVDIEQPAEEIVEETAAEEVVEETAVEEEDDDLPGVFDEPVPVTIATKAEVTAKPTINDVMASEHAWRKDMPGTPVRDIRSAISLNDRVIFINLLFNEDAQAFVNALTRINSMETLDEAVDFISSEFPSWDLNSDLVYRFMMAVRRKVR